MWSQMKTNTDASQNNRNNPDGVLRQKIEERAYLIWLESGCGHGNHEHHWFQAEREVVEAAKLKQEQRSGTSEKKRIGRPH
jgi:hypothetical protein